MYKENDMGNNRKENFIRIAENRTNKILDLIKLLGNLSNKSYYDFISKQVVSIFNTIQNELEEQKKRFSTEKKDNKRFRL